jgi:hypothetical protein
MQPWRATSSIYHPIRMPAADGTAPPKRRGRRDSSEPDTPESANRFANIPDQEAPRRIGTRHEHQPPHQRRIGARCLNPQLCLAGLEVGSGSGPLRG